jgi:hypothetical protein
MNNRLAPVAEHIIDKTQNAFMKNRHIMEGVCVLHEVLHAIKKKKISRVLFKVDFEKAYDNMNWAFLYNILLKKGFHINGMIGVFSIMTSGEVNIKINDQTGAYFSTNRGDKETPFLPFFLMLWWIL